MDLNPQQVLQICKNDTEIAGYFHEMLAHIRVLTDTVQQQANEIKSLKAEIHELKRQLGQNSNNSSKPPSSDGFRKPTNLRTPGGKKGAPKGHQGHTLDFVSTPDEIIVYELSSCANCSATLDGVTKAYVRRQVFDVPLPRLCVTEHRAEKACCPHCHINQHATFPKGIDAPVQYGDGFTAWTAYFSVYQLLPLERITRLFYDLTGYQPSQATLLAQINRMTIAVESIIPFIREQLRSKPVVHTDETGLRLQGKQHWLHSVSDADWTYLAIHPNRGSGAIEKMDVLTTYKGVVVHDCLNSYFKPEYRFEHALCNVHLMRECKGIAEHDRHQWAIHMKDLLKESWDLAKAARIVEEPLTPEVISHIELRYDHILHQGKIEWDKDPVPVKTGPRGRKSKSKAANLGERFQLNKGAILRFLSDARVPFDNNQAERDIRMTKVKSKISGAFRTIEGGEQLATIRSFISTLIKQKLPLHSSLLSLLRGQFNF